MKIIPLLADPSNPYNGQHLYILKSLAEVKSIVLLGDIPNSTALTSNLFTTCFDVLSGPSKADSGEELSKNVEHHMTAILSILIDESPQVSPDVTDVILAQFLRADVTTLSTGSSKGKKSAPVDTKQSTLLMKEAPPPYNMAKNICNICSDKMARAVGSYFSTVIVDVTSGASVPKHRGRNRAGSDADDSDAEGQKGPSEDDLNEASKAHRLLRELWRCSPEVLQEIIPHLQEELGAENVHLRQMATETFGDMISGIGAAGPPPPPVLNPVAYPSQSLNPNAPAVGVYNFLTTPTSPKSFAVQHPAAYAAFLQRKQDKSANIRAAWTTGISRILMTSAGGVGLDPEEEQKLLRYFSETLIDSDDRVRLAAVKAIEYFGFDDIIQKLGSIGSMSDQGSILANLADRVKDRKTAINTESMKLLGKIWGVAAGAIAEGNERVTNLLGPIPTRILETCYVNDPEINARVDLTMFESLLPLGYPPMKAKAAVNGSQAAKDSQSNVEQGYTEADLDKIRTERQLVLIRSLEEKAKKVFFALQGNQVANAAYMESFLKRCEEYNGGVMEEREKEIKANLTGLIHYYAKTLPDPQRVIEDLWKFAKAHDRRSYQLIRFCMAPDSDYRKVFRSIVSTADRPHSIILTTAQERA
jgi:sister chromatid cohesion protein PDS5